MAGATGIASTSGAAAASRGADRHDTWQFVALVAQLAVLLLLVDRFKLESEAFLRLTALTVGGFAVHYFLPLRYRLPFFVVLSLAGIVMVLGPMQAAWLIAVGLVLIGISHLPINFYARAGLLLAIGLALAVSRRGLGGVPWSDGLWPLLGSLFVFRLFSYLYDRKHKTEPSSLWQTLAYFFLLPNVCFPLFPIIDFKLFCRSYYSEERHRIYQVGVEWIWRGLLQLLLYRLVYFHITIDPVAVEDAGDLAVYVFSTYLLYLRLSGYFHIVVGMLHLFGFNLPETHHRYFLASSFTDFWRRINIYWKDFMMKVFYYPTFFLVRRFGNTQALIIATICTFIATWSLHLTQWFWIRGSILVEWNDILFWTLFAALVLINSLRESRQGSISARAKRERSLAGSLGLVLRTVGTFLTIAVMWSFWTAESMTDWYLMWAGAMRWPSWPAWQVVASVTTLVAAIAVAVYAVWKGWSDGPRALGPTVARGTILATSLLLSAVTLPAVSARLGAGRDLVDSLSLASTSALNRRDAEEFQRGYYEQLLDIGKFNDDLQRMYDQMPADFVRSLAQIGLSRPTGDEQEYELTPGAEGVFMGKLVRINRWGMRDDEYAIQRPPHTYRMALVGPSTAMASGVDAQDSFEAVVERRLNDSQAEGTSAGVHYEVLNFGVAGYSPQQALSQLRRNVIQFQPNAVIYLAHSSDVERASSHLIRTMRRRILSADPFVQELTRQTGIQPQTGPTEARRRMKPHARAFLLHVYREMARECRERGIRPLFVYLETVVELQQDWHTEQRLAVLELAREAGFEVLDLTGAYAGYTAPQLWVLANDGHANALGNRLIADRLFARLKEREVVPATE